MSPEKETERGKVGKRELPEESSSDDEMVGPSLSDAAPQKKKKVLEYEKVFLGNE